MGWIVLLNVATVVIAVMVVLAYETKPTKKKKQSNYAKGDYRYTIKQTDDGWRVKVDRFNTTFYMWDHMTSFTGPTSQVVEEQAIEYIAKRQLHLKWEREKQVIDVRMNKED